jgi:branched-chain amino acid transport system substrate-binding protein
MRVGARLRGLIVVAVLVACGNPVMAEETVKIAFIATFSGASGITGQHMYDGFMLGLDHAGGNFGGVKTSVLKYDDQLKPDVGLKIAREVAESEKVNFVVGFGFSNVLLAAAKPILDSKTFLISGNAGPIDFARSRCSPFLFVASFVNPFKDEAAGVYVTKKGYRRVYLMAANYAAGREAIAGFKSTFQGEVIGEVYTKLDQVDYSAELSQLRAAKPDAAYVFYPGGWGVNFIKQFYQAGLRNDVPLISKATVDATNLPAQGEAAVGSLEAAHWNSDIQNDANKRFVADFIKKYGYVPSAFAETSYDVAQLIDAAVRRVKGDLSDKDGIRKGLEEANIASPRGPFKYDTNHFPIQNVYIVKAVKKFDGSIALETQELLQNDMRDQYAAECSMK